MVTLNSHESTQVNMSYVNNSSGSAKDLLIVFESFLRSISSFFQLNLTQFIYDVFSDYVDLKDNQTVIIAEIDYLKKVSD